MEQPAEFYGLTLDDISEERQQRIAAQRNEAFMQPLNSEVWARSISPPPHLIFDTFERRNQRAWLVIDPPWHPSVPATRQHTQRIDDPRDQPTALLDDIGRHAHARLQRVRAPVC